MLKPQFILNLAAKLVIVLFAGAGGSCTGIEKHIRRHVDIAANHSETAISCHRANHPQTRHEIEDVRRLDPRALTGNQAVGYLHASPDCTHFSQAKGGQPRDKATRSLTWVVVRWAGQVRPDVITLENVKEIRKWGPLVAKRDKATGRVVRLDGTIAEPGERVPLEQQFLIPDPKRAGQTWNRFLQLLRAMGYQLDHRVLCAADYGVPQRRNRLFMVARCDGKPVTWPEPTHHQKPQKGQKRWVPAHKSIDFTIPSKSIFDRPKPLAEATLRRVARGLKKYVLDSGDPFIVPIANWSSETVQSVRDPLSTVTAWPRGGSFSMVAPTLVQAGYGERAGQAPRALDIEQPLGVVTAGGVKHALSTAYLTRFQTGSVGQDLREPATTITAGGTPKRPSTGNKLGLVTAFVEQANGGFNNTPAHDSRSPFSTVTASGSNQRVVTAHLSTMRNNMVGEDLREPIRTVAASGEHHALVEYSLSPEAEEGALRCAAFFIEYYSEGGQWSDLRAPINTLTTRDRLALVTVWIKGDPYVVVDICLRMLKPRELANATSFPPQYIINRGHDGRVFTNSQQVHMIGNAVPPELQYHVTAANYSETYEPASAELEAA